MSDAAGPPPRAFGVAGKLRAFVHMLWNMLMAFIAFIMSRRQAFESLMEFLETFDASRVLASTQFRFLVGDREIKSRARKLLQAKGASLEPDLAPSNFFDVRRDSRRATQERCGSVDVEILQAGGWTRGNMGDTFTAEDVFCIVICDGGVSL